MHTFIHNTTEFVPFQEEAKKIATNVINWINQAFVPGQWINKAFEFEVNESSFSPDFKTSYRVNGIWSMFGDEGKTIVEDAEDEIGV